MWHLYLIECANGSYYAGIAKDVQARYKAHAAGKGARYTRSNPPRRLMASREFADRSLASKAEWAIKQLPRSKKLGFFEL